MSDSDKNDRAHSNRVAKGAGLGGATVLGGGLAAGMAAAGPVGWLFLAGWAIGGAFAGAGLAHISSDHK